MRGVDVARGERDQPTASSWPSSKGERCLVSMLGDDVDWLRNVRAAGGNARLRLGRGEEVRLDEVAAHCVARWATRHMCDPWLSAPAWRRQVIAETDLLCPPGGGAVLLLIA